MGVKAGVLYVVATPIGNLEDISQRALKVLASVDRIAAEDTRHSQRLLGHYGISTPMVAFHEHNEREMAEALVGSLGAGESIALISDAGTPLISDPGFRLTRAAQAAGMPVVAVARGREEPGLEPATWKLATLDDLALTPRGEVIVKGSPSARGRM